MERVATEDRVDTKFTGSVNATLARGVLEKILALGVQEFCLCPGKRNAPFFWEIESNPLLKVTRWFDERSAGFYALGRTRSQKAPVAVVTTSGTAVGELLPSVMEGYYSGDPLLVISADRPRRFRGTGAPQCAEQAGIFGIYTPYSWDVATDEEIDLSQWDLWTPAHVNVCFEEPDYDEHGIPFQRKPSYVQERGGYFPSANPVLLSSWLASRKAPLAIVSGLSPSYREVVIRFLLRCQMPIIAEATSGLREEERLSHLLIHGRERVVETAIASEYDVDGILRIGRIPTLGLWRDLERKEGNLPLFSLSDLPFSGTPGGQIAVLRTHSEWESLMALPVSAFASLTLWKERDQKDLEDLQRCLRKEPRSEPALFFALSQKIPKGSLVYLGNSQPIREWDSFSTEENRGFTVLASRGLNGIDGQLATFFGCAQEGRENWAILGDQTTLYDMGAPWVLKQMENACIRIVVVNNGGGKIFSRMKGGDSLQNRHTLSFEPIAAMWGLSYYRWDSIPDSLPEEKKPVLIEWVSDSHWGQA